MQKSKENIIWEKLNELRSQSPHMRIGRFIDMPLLIEIFEELGEDEFDKVLDDKERCNILTDRFGIQVPQFLYDFIDTLIVGINGEKIFDPWITTNSFFVKKRYDKIVGYSRMASEIEIIKEYLKVDTSKIIIGDSFESIDSIQTKYDLIISFPPFGMKQMGSKRQDSTNDFAIDLLFELADKITDNGKIIFLVSPKFGFDSKTKKKLENSDLNLDGLFHLPEGTFTPTTNISSYLAILSKKQKTKPFIAELSESGSSNETIFKNFQKNIEGKSPKLGRIIPFSEFTSFRAIEQTEELRRLGKITGFKPSKFVELCSEITILKAKNKEEVEHISNSIYLPKVGNSIVVDESNDLRIKPHNYFQITLDDKKANSTYIANYFNTPLGRIALESIKVGSVISNITKSALDNCIVFIPNLTGQFDTLSELNKIKSIKSDMRDLEIKLWQYPKALPSIKKNLKKYEQKDTFKDWLDSLPFPLSSILWRFQATNDESKKIEHLLHFFEAFSEFISLLLLSSFNQNKELYENEKQRWVSNDEQYKDWYLKSTFGGWNNLTARLSKATRTLFNDKERKELIRLSFGKPSEEFTSLVTNKSLFNILDEAREYRNKKAHGGLSSKTEIKQKVTILEQTLLKLRKVIGDGFSRSKLISANTSTYSDGIFSYNATELTGTRTPFNEIILKSIKPLDTKALYFLHDGSDTPIELIPFLKYDQQTKACYFYNSIEGSGVKFVSFHFDKNSEITEEINEKFKEVLKILERKENDREQ